MAWLFRVVRNRSISLARGDARRARHEGAAAKQSGRWFEPSFQQNQRIAAAAEAAGELPIELREVVVLHFWGGLTFAEVADLTGVSTSTAHRRFENAIVQLREQLNIPCPTNEKPNL